MPILKDLMFKSVTSEVANFWIFLNESPESVFLETKPKIELIIKANQDGWIVEYLDYLDHLALVLQGFV